MSSRLGGPSVPSPRSEEPLLDPHSYTAHRLHHATPEHLHLTTRRVFVGPIPAGWLRNHHSEWYNDHLHLHYSKRQATFSTNDDFSRNCRLTGLESHESSQGRLTQGLTPSPFEGEDRSTTAEPILVPLRHPLSFGSTRAGPQQRRNGKQRVEEEEDQGQEDEEDNEATPRPAPQSPTSVRTATTSAKRTGSFATAHEDWGSPGSRPRSNARSEMQDENIIRFDEPPQRETVGSEFEETPRARTVEARDSAAITINDSEAGTSSSADPSVQTSSSLASLLKSDTTPGQKGAKASPSGIRRKSIQYGEGSKALPSILSLGRRTKSQPTQRVSSQTEEAQGSSTAPERNSTNKDKVSGGLVRFNTEVDTRERDRRMQQKLADLSRHRSLRYSGRRLPHLRKREGEIIKMENMLIRVELAKSHQLSDVYDENESMKVSTRVIEKWREFVVVCRENGDEEVPMVLRLYKSRKIPAIDRPHISSRSTRQIPLNAKSTKVNIYSSLDKSLVIWFPHKRGTMVFIMRPRCFSAAVEWHTFLRGALRLDRPSALMISVPDLSLSLKIDKPFAKIEATLKEGADSDDEAPAREELAVAQNLLQQSMDMLDGVEEWADIIRHWKNDERMGLAWRRYDRIEWVHGANERRMYGTLAMQRTHELELRPKTHYPTETVVDSRNMIEPPPVEGFLIRLTSGKGRQQRLGRLFSKRLYVTTHNHYLCFCKPAKAIPPRPPNLRPRGGEMPSDDDVANKTPLVFAVAPYSLNDKGDIDWLAADRTPEFIHRKDQEAYDEAERKVNTLLGTEEFVDLCRVEEVRRVVMQKGPATDDNPDAWGDSHRSDGDGPEEPIHDPKLFELVLRGGLVLKLQSFDAQTRDEWIQRLKDLIEYWKARDREDLAIVRRTRDENLKLLNVDEEMESVIGQYARKWEVSRSVASGEMYNVCGLSSCRTITMSGVLFRKPRRHSTFRRFHIILCHGELLVFQRTNRTQSGKETPTVYQERKQSISLRDCYIYSGLVTESELLYSNRTFDSNSPGRHPLPRIYYDGYTSHDEDSMTCFVLWHGNQKATVRTKNDAGEKVSRRVNKLGKKGNSIVFKARSRVERDIWVMSIAMEIERLNTDVSEEIQVTPQKSGIFTR